MKVLIVEDNPDSRNLLAKQLSAYGHEVTAAVDGVDALEKAQKSPPDILVSDILMPRMDGYKLCYEWKQHKQLKDIPFVFYTAIYTSGEDEKFALSLGANLFIRKPIEPEALAKILSQAFEQAKEGLLPPAKAPPKPSLYLTEYNERLVAKLNEKVAELEKSEEEIRYISSVLGAIRSINQLIVRGWDKTRLLKEACRILHKVREYRFVWIGLIEAGHKRVIPMAWAGVEDGYLESVKITWDDSESGQGPASKAIKNKKPELIKNIPESQMRASWREEARKRGHRSSAALPIIHDDRVYGVLNVYSSQLDGFSNTEVELLEEVSGDLAFALEAIERQEALRESEAFRSGLLAHSPTPINVINPDGSMRYLNPAMEKLTGYSAKELIGQKPPYPYWLDENQAKTMKNFKKAMRQGGKGVVELFKKKNGEEFWVEITSTPVKKDGKFQYMLTSWVDVTERKQAEDALQKERDRAQEYLDIAGVMIIVIGKDKRIKLVNQKGCQILGCDEKEIVGKDWFRNCLPKRIRAEVEAGFEKMIAGDIKHLEYHENPVLTKSGKERIIAWNNTVIRDDAGQVVATLSSGEDITERKQAEEALRESEARYRAVIEGAYDMIQSVGLDGSIIFVNKAWLDTLGYTEAELSALNMFDVIHPESQEHCREMLAEVVKGKPARNLEATFLTKDGRKILVEGSAAPRYIGKKVVATQGIFRDVTARKQAEEALQLRAQMLDGATDVIFVHDIDGNLIYVNEATCRIHGYSREELLKMKVQQLVPQDELDGFEAIRRKTMGKGKMVFEAVHLCKDGSRMPMEINSRTIESGGRKLILAIARDITERKRAESALRQSEEKLRVILESIPLGVTVTDLEGKILQANDAALRVHGYNTRQELIGQNAFELIAKEGHARAIDNLKKTLETGRGGAVEYTLLRKDGTTFPAQLSAALVKDETAKPIGFVAVTEDITERKQAEEALRESEEKYKNLVGATSDIIWETDVDGRFTFISPKVKDILGYEVDEVVGKKRTLDLIAKGQFRKWLERFKELNAKRESFFGLEIPHLHKNGRQVIFETSGIPLFDSAGKLKGYVGINRDITERRQMQEQLVITDRLASVGELAAGIAHELNNPLTGVIGFSQLLMDKEMPDDIKQDVKVVYGEARRASQVVKNLLTFARKHAAAKEKVNINDIIKKVLELRAYEQNLENISVDARLDPKLPEVMVDYFQLQQVFLNIIINAEYFMKEDHRKGTLTITTERVGNKVRASFADDGPGIAKENLGHLFDPFFTTKEVGKGTGLGLSICHGIVAEHGGRIYVESELGKGATFIVELPIGAAERKGGTA